MRGSLSQIDLCLAVAEARGAMGSAEKVPTLLRETLPRLRRRVDDIPDAEASARYLTEVPTHAQLLSVATEWLGKEALREPGLIVEVRYALERPSHCAVSRPATAMRSICSRRSTGRPHLSAWGTLSRRHVSRCPAAGQNDVGVSMPTEARGARNAGAMSAGMYAARGSTARFPSSQQSRESNSMPSTRNQES